MVREGREAAAAVLGRLHRGEAADRLQRGDIRRAHRPHGPPRERRPRHRRLQDRWRQPHRQALAGRAARRAAAPALRGVGEGGDNGGGVRQVPPGRHALRGSLARRQGAAEGAEGERRLAAAAARLEEGSRASRPVVRGRRGGRRPEEGPHDLPLLRPGDAVPRVREDQRACRRGDRGVVKEMRDAALRDRALDVRRSFIVQAPAGSGKTDLLVRRFLKLLSSVQKPEEILAITFTKKAAAEMRKRILKELPNSGEIAHRLRIQTIDAFCTALTRQVPVLARFGAQPEIVDDARDLYWEAASRVFQQFNPASEKLLAHLDNNVPLATGLLANMLDNRDRWLRKTGAVPTRAELEATLAAERERLLRKAKALFPGASEALARGVLRKDGQWLQRPAAPEHLKKIPGLREALFALCNMPPAEYEDRQWEALEAILALLKPAVAHLKVLFGERGQADFTEFAHGALEALGSVDDPSDLLLSLDQKISHVLVDEFQDTSLSQFELLTKLTSGWQEGDGRTLFLVGDPMQSIYRFREAEVSLFLQAKHSGLGSVKLEPIELSTNRRSQEGLVKWFNESFPRVLPAQEDQTSGAVPYLPASPHEPALPGAAVTWHCGYDREEEAKKVVAIVREASGSKAILVRNRAHLDEIVPALKEAGVRFRALDIEQLGEKQVVQDLYALTRALLHLGDRIAWLACLRAPWCGLTLADLLALSSGRSEEGGSEYNSGGALILDKMRDVTHLSADGQKRVDRVRSILAPLVKNRLRGSLRERVEGAWLALGGPACAERETDLEDAEIFLDELERLEEAGEVDLAALEDKIDRRLYAQPDVK